MYTVSVHDRLIFEKCS